MIYCNSPVKKSGGPAAGVPRTVSDASSSFGAGTPKDQVRCICAPEHPFQVSALLGLFYAGGFTFFGGSASLLRVVGTFGNKYGASSRGRHLD